MSLVARIVLIVLMLSACALGGVGLVKVAELHGVWMALAIFPGIPVFASLGFLLIHAAYPDKPPC